MTQISLPHGGQLWYYPEYLTQEESDRLLEELQGLEWVISKYKMWGKEVPNPRRLTSMYDPQFVSADAEKGDRETDWMEVGKKGWTPMMGVLRDRLCEQFGVAIMYAQMNHYRDGEDYIGWHCDNEMADGDWVFSISLGMEREFRIREKWQRQPDGSLMLDAKNKPIKEKRTGKEVWVTPPLLMGNGSLVVFDTDTGKHHYKHSVPKAKKGAVDARGLGRFNITFRTTASATTPPVAATLCPAMTPRPSSPAIGTPRPVASPVAIASIGDAVTEVVARHFLTMILQDPPAGYAAVKTRLWTRTGDIPTEATLGEMATILEVMFTIQEIDVALSVFRCMFIQPQFLSEISIEEATTIANKLLASPDVGYEVIFQSLHHHNGAPITPESLMEVAGPILTAMFETRDVSQMADFIHHWLR